MNTYKPTIVLDFDGVIHSYTSGWKGAKNIPDNSVPGAIKFILMHLKVFDICILSSRSHQWGGRRAMKKWLKKELIAWLNERADKYMNQFPALDTTFKLAEFDQGMEPWDVAVDDWADSVINKIKWPLFKPAALITIDDRAITFNGQWPTTEEINQFKPWYK